MRWITSSFIERVYNRIVNNITNLLLDPNNAALQETFNSFHTTLRGLFHDSLTRQNTISMLAKHIISRPVFNELFGNINFINNNPVAATLNRLQEDFSQFGLQDETRDLDSFYQTVRRRGSFSNNTEDRQQFLSELYEDFFEILIKQDIEQENILFTPIEITDFMLHSVNEILQTEFGRYIGDQGIHVLDPFAGTGTFFVRLIQSGLIQSEQLERKYHEELHANENALIPYYLAAASIEETFRNRYREDSNHEHFNGIVLTDTFNLNLSDYFTPFAREWLVNNSERAERQQLLPIEVVLGNPPWLRRHPTSSNRQYPALELRIRETYQQHTTATVTTSLYDTYKLAFRWASDRIDKQGIIAFVTNGSWIDSRVDAGVRACMAAEFSSIYVLNLRGSARLLGNQRRSEGENVFGSRIRAPVAITILVKNPKAIDYDCKIYYKDIGDNLTRDQKLQTLRNAVSISGFNDWRMITPDGHNDWIRQRSEVFAQFFPIGSRATRHAPVVDAIFDLFSRGLKTGRDMYAYNFSRHLCALNAQRMHQEYNAALADLEADPSLIPEDTSQRYTQNLRWDQELRNNLNRGTTNEFDENNIRIVAYRPFVKMNCYIDNVFIQRSFQIPRIFPSPTSKNLVICIPSFISRLPFSAVMIDTIPDWLFNEHCQCFPRYHYSENVDTSGSIEAFQDSDEVLYRIDNISDAALDAFQRHYNTTKITKDEIFYYVYGILHSPTYIEQFEYDLTRGLPRIPFAPDFIAFADAGLRLADLHLHYETCPQYPLDLHLTNTTTQQVGHFRLGTRTMRFTNRERTSLGISDYIHISDIPSEAHRFKVNGRTPLEWIISRFRITQDRHSSIINNPNDWFTDPRDIVDALKRIVYVSVESTRIIDNLPAEIMTTET